MVPGADDDAGLCGHVRGRVLLHQHEVLNLRAQEQVEPARGEQHRAAHVGDIVAEIVGVPERVLHGVADPVVVEIELEASLVVRLCEGQGFHGARGHEVRGGVHLVARVHGAGPAQDRGQVERAVAVGHMVHVRGGHEGHHGRERIVGLLEGGPLGEAHVGAAGGGGLSVAPGLCEHPLERVGAVRAFVAQGGEITLGIEPAARIHGHHGDAPFREHAGVVALLESGAVVGRADNDHGERAAALRQVHVGLEQDPVAHGDIHDFKGLGPAAHGRGENTVKQNQQRTSQCHGRPR